MSIHEPSKIELGIAGREFSWVGYCPWSKSEVFGTDDGHLYQQVPGKSQVMEFPERLFDDPVNSGAFSNDWAVFGSRSDVVVLQRNDDFFSNEFKPMKLLFGIHDVVCSVNNTFFAAGGVNGVISIRSYHGQVAVEFGTLNNIPFDPYDIVVVEDSIEPVLAMACRSRGIMGFRSLGPSHNSEAIFFQFGTSDVIGVSSVANPTNPRAVIAATRQGQLIYVEDVLDKKGPFHVVDLDIEGALYSVIAFQGDIAVLTSKQFRVYPGLVADIHSTENLGITKAFLYDFLPEEMSLGENKLFYFLEDGGISPLSHAELLNTASGNQKPCPINRIKDAASSTQSVPFRLEAA